MILDKDELLAALAQEVHILQHLVSKVDEPQLEYRPTAKQRSTLELLRYLAIFGPIHLRAVLLPHFDMDAWGKDWKEGQASAEALDLAALQETFGKLPGIYAEQLAPLSAEAFREEFEMFGYKRSRGAWLVNLLLCHHTAYRMQLFLYLKSNGHEELNTMNLWAGLDPAKRG